MVYFPFSSLKQKPASVPAGVPQANWSDYATSSALNSAVAPLSTVDEDPTENSTNLVESGGVFTALASAGGGPQVAQYIKDTTQSFTSSGFYSTLDISFGTTASYSNISPALTFDGTTFTVPSGGAGVYKFDIVLRAFNNNANKADRLLLNINVSGVVPNSGKYRWDQSYEGDLLSVPYLENLSVGDTIKFQLRAYYNAGSTSLEEKECRVIVTKY